ncbi:MAG: hypothetical protein WCE68_18860 [Anaerolineales bacterium]
MTTASFQLNPDETILYRSRPAREWYALAGRLGAGLIELIFVMVLSFTAFTNLARVILAKFIPAAPASVLGQVIFQGIFPILMIAWFAEDTASIFTREVILTSQRVWTKGFPRAWNAEWETRLSDIKCMSFKNGAVSIHLKDNKKMRVRGFPNGALIVKAFKEFTEKNAIDPINPMN